MLGMLLVLGLAAAQTAQLDLRLSRDWGFGGLDNKIQGTFSLHASGPEDLVEVRFLMDGAVIQLDTEPPFSYQFQTGAFDSGQHQLSAVGKLRDGTEIQSAVIVRNFISAEDAGSIVKDFVLPLLLVVGAIAIIGVGGPLLLGRNRKHVPGQYGAAGGAVCRRCGFPFSRSMLAPNLVFGKLERCPHCGKWAIVPRASATALADAEERLAAEGKVQAPSAESEEEKHRRLLDESRFDE